jgi:hypothetical protein
MYGRDDALVTNDYRELAGIEYDRVNPGSPLERPLQVLSHSPLTCRE